MIKRLLVMAGVCAVSFYATAQDPELYMPRDIKAAYLNGSRALDGNPGGNYFQNRVDYDISARIDPVTRRLTGYEKITFHNNSPYDLKTIGLRFYQDIFVKGGNRGRPVNPADLTDGVDLTSLTINGKKIDPGSSSATVFETQTNKFYRIQAKAGSQNIIEATWTLTFPGKKEERMGSIDESSFFIAYWYPQIAVFDDINGWDTFDYNNVAEMYNEFGNFDVSLTLPEDFVVWATGELQNPEKVLSENCLKRYISARSSSDVVHIIDKKDIRKKQATQKKKNEWRFKALNVSDFAFGISDHYVWDASSLALKNGKDIFIQSAWLPSSTYYEPVAQMTRFVVSQLSDSITGIDFPYPSITVFNGNDGMEFPMIVNDEEENSSGGTWFLTAHEVTHTYLPFYVGINQRRYGWMDEGMTTMLGEMIHSQKTDLYNMRNMYLYTYPRIAGTQEDVPTIVNSTYLPDIIFQQHEYMRPSMALWTLKDILGEAMFRKCLQGFITRWAGKHPTPYDLFFTFNDISGEDLNWFWQPWFLGFNYPDLAIEKVEKTDSGFSVYLGNEGGMPFPASLEIRFDDGTTRMISLDARVWAKGKTHIITIAGNKNISGLVLHTEGYPDSVNENNYYPSSGE
ncbi:MAG TPA: M1 family metallopeptidase [Bacteroidales bacterium]|nr:M1 family metallopeptidase [Bacteroidales bacterium]